MRRSKKMFVEMMLTSYSVVSADEVDVVLASVWRQRMMMLM